MEAHRSRPRTLVVAAAMLIASLAAPVPAAAAGIIVNTTADELNSDADCSLREAITAANTDTVVDACSAGSGDDVITFSGLGFNAIGVASQLPTITTTLTIDGTIPGAVFGRPISGLSAPGGTRILQNQGNLTLRNVAFFNGSGSSGGAVMNDASGVLLIEGTWFLGNGPAEFGGAVYNAGTMTVMGSTFDGNRTGFTCPGCPGGAGSSGGAIFNAGDMTIESSYFTGNNARATGGAIRNGGTATIRNTTIFGNSGGNFGGGINSNGVLVVESSTIVANGAELGGAGIETGDVAGASTSISGSILSNNSGQEDCNGPTTDLGYNVIEDGTCITDPTSVAATADLDFASRDNGGPTKTVPINATSPAVDAIPPGVLGCGTTLVLDQRGVSRPQSDDCDIGAFERTPDGVAPMSTLETFPQQDPFQGWYSGDPTFRIAATDPRPVLVDHPSGVAESRCLLNPTSEPTDFAELGSDCILAMPGSHLEDGIYEVYFASRDNADNREAVQFAELKIDTVRPTVTCPDPLPTFIRGTIGATLTATVSDATSGPASATVTKDINTSSLGEIEVLLVGFDNAGWDGFVLCMPKVGYATSFLRPTGASFKPGSAIVVEMSLGDATANRITDAEGSQLARSCSVRVALDGATTVGDCATYGKGSDSFTYRLRTAKSIALGQHTIVVEVVVSDVVVNRETMSITIAR